MGKVVLVATAPDGGCDLLAVTQIASSSEPLHLGSPEWSVLELRSLPYTVTDEA